MDRNFKLFLGCVESLRIAEKEYQKNSTPFNQNIVEGLQNKVDGWIVWFHEKEQGNTKAAFPPFIGGKTPYFSDMGGLSNDIKRQLLANHTPEEIEKYARMMGWKI